MKGKRLLVVHGGGPTPVINASLYGAVRAAQAVGVREVLGTVRGIEGVLNDHYVRLDTLTSEQLSLLTKTPGSVLGTSRKHLGDSDYDAIIQKLTENQIDGLLFNGGNGSMDTCGKIHQKAREKGIGVIGIPKTIDNDIAVTDHSPGYGSAARYLAGSVAEIWQDVKSMPIHIVIVEAMGRNAGWITAASALARQKKGDAPHLIYLPEVPFDTERFLKDVKALWDKQGGAVVVVSEGIRDKEGKPVVSPILTRGRDVYFGDVAAHLSALVTVQLGIKCRSEKPGILGRASVAWQSSCDVQEAIQMGEAAVRALCEGKTGCMVGLKRTSDCPYACVTQCIPIEEVMLKEKKMPPHFIAPEGNDVTRAFVDYARPLIGEALPTFLSLR